MLMFWNCDIYKCLVNDENTWAFMYEFTVIFNDRPETRFEVLQILINIMNLLLQLNNC